MEIEVKSARTGGRSAKIQKSVHDAVNKLLAITPTSEITVYAVANEAGVPPSTIYRRWGDINRLLADVAVQHLYPETVPKDMGSYQADIIEWVEQYYEEMASETGRDMLREIIYAKECSASSQCTDMINTQLEVINKRAHERGEKILSNENIINFVVSPIIFHILFDTQSLTIESVHSLINRLLINNEI
ncbi:TetR/AcrR family transcriptional regulator [Providencia burhodogranariea]|uniref:HTH tetR-type domain-containing protein n=1 Tax=Providencia burhodogranariea DSM 19968 TaxID=1141662 RepID=K8X8N4_9GAMM|nr:TetR-like C-terminal domain-containing protein [Providencia burhodogranariea]EKT64780.1 hypothetical protein OOA_01892 [Providencia burhodogranariea DSM 19968]